MFYSLMHTADDELVCAASKKLVENEKYDGHSLEDIEEMYVFDINSLQLGHYVSPPDIIYYLKNPGLGVDQYNNFKSALRNFFELLLEQISRTELDVEKAVIKNIFNKKFYSLNALIKLLRAIE